MSERRTIKFLLLLGLRAIASMQSVSCLSSPLCLYPSFSPVAFVSLSLSISLSSIPTPFIATVKVKTNPIDQPAHGQMDVGSNYW